MDGDISSPHSGGTREDPYTPPMTVQRPQQPRQTIMTSRRPPIPMLKGPKRAPDERNWSEGPTFSEWRRAVENYCAVEGLVNDIDKINVAKNYIDSSAGLAYKVAHSELRHIADNITFHTWMIEVRRVCERMRNKNESSWIRSMAEALTYRRNSDESFVQFYVRAMHLPKFLYEGALDANYSKEVADILSCAMFEFLLFYEMPEECAELAGQVEGEPMRFNTASIFAKMDKKVGDPPYKPSIREVNERRFRFSMPKTKAVDAIKHNSKKTTSKRKVDDNKEADQKETCFYCKKKGHVKKDCYTYLDDQGKRCKRCHQTGHGKVDCKNPPASRSRPVAALDVEEAQAQDNGQESDTEVGAFLIKRIRLDSQSEDEDIEEPITTPKFPIKPIYEVDSDSEDEIEVIKTVRNSRLGNQRETPIVISSDSSSDESEDTDVSDDEAETSQEEESDPDSSDNDSDIEPNTYPSDDAEAEDNSPRWSPSDNEASPIWSPIDNEVLAAIGSPQWSPSDNEDEYNGLNFPPPPRFPTPFRTEESTNPEENEPEAQTNKPTKPKPIAKVYIEGDSDEESDQEEERVLNISKNNPVSIPARVEEDRIYVNLRCETVDTLVLVDCGASVNLIEERLFQDMGTELLPTNSKLVGAFGQRVTPAGKTFFNLYLTPNYHIRIKAYIVDSVESVAEIILGFRTLNMNGAIINLRSKEIEFLKSGDFAIASASREAHQDQPVETPIDLSCRKDTVLYARTVSMIPVSYSNKMSPMENNEKDNVEKNVYTCRLITGNTPEVEGIKVAPGLIDENNRPSAIKLANFTPTDILVRKGEKIAEANEIIYVDSGDENE